MHTTNWQSHLGPDPSQSAFVFKVVWTRSEVAILGYAALQQLAAQLPLDGACLLQHQIHISALCACRLMNGASLSKQDQADLQRGRSALLQLTSRKRSRATSGLDRDSSPSTSTAARSQDRAYRRTTSAHEGGATSKPHKPVRCTSETVQPLLLVHVSIVVSASLCCCLF